MQAQKNILAFIFILASGNVHCQTALTPLEVAKKIFSKTKFAEIKKYSTGEYNGEPDGQQLGKNASTTFMLLEQTAGKAVVVMTITDSTGKGVDTYLHFIKKDVWKLAAFRALAMTGIIEAAKKELESMSNEQIDSMIAIARSAPADGTRFASKEEYEYELGNLALTLALDSELIVHFNKNKNEFERLKDIALKSKDSVKEGDESTRICKWLEKDLHKLFISSIETGDYMLGSNCLSFSIGGILDNTVGYLFVQDKKDLPKMDPAGIIMIREIGNGWYIYKTT